MTPRRRPTSRATAVSMLALALLGACASSPAERFYALSAGAPPAAPEAGPETPLSILVTQAAVPDLVDRPQLVLQGEKNQVTILEQQRWAEPLRVGVSRVVAENLERLLAGPSVSTREDALGEPQCRVNLDIRRLEARQNVAVTVEALWNISCKSASGRTGRSIARMPVVDGGSDALVAAAGAALDAISREIASALCAVGVRVGREDLPDPRRISRDDDRAQDRRSAWREAPAFARSVSRTGDRLR